MAADPGGAPKQEPNQDSSQLRVTMLGRNTALGPLVDNVMVKRMRPRLVIAHDAVQKAFPITQSKFVIGRSDNVRDAIDLALEHPAVSQPHAEILYDDRRFYIQDSDSKNKTYFGREILEVGRPRELLPDTHLRFGVVNALFVVDADSRGTPVSQKLYEAALQLLVAEKVITPTQLATATQEAAQTNQHVGETLLLRGAITVQQWANALEHGPTMYLARQYIRQARFWRLVATVSLVLLAGLLTFVLVQAPEVFTQLWNGK